MSIECDVDHLNDKLRAIILQELHVKRVDPMSKRHGGAGGKGGFGFGFGGGLNAKKEVITYRIVGRPGDPSHELIFLPLHFAVSVLEAPRPPRTSFPSHQLRFAGTLRPTQLEVRKDAIEHLNERGCTLLALHVGFGKSVLAIELACKIRLRTMIVVHRVVLIDQWKEYVQKYCRGWEGRMKVFEDSTNDDDCDVLIINVLNIPKLPESFLRTFGFVIVDECHLISTEHFSRSLQFLTPRYMVGLSATPYRNDGMDKIMDLYFGKERLTRALRISHTVYKILTSFEPPLYQTRTGQLDWNRVMEAQSSHRERNDMIVRLAKLYPERHILILCKRREQGMILIDKLQQEGEHVTRLMGNDRTFDKSARILVATINKAGVGFSHDVLDTLILAADVEEYYIQYLGRITRRPDVQPLIFDIVDKNPTLVRHFATRRKVYKEIGGTIVDFRRAYPDFHVI